MNEGDGTPAIADDVAQAGRRRQPIVGTCNMHTGRREGRHQKVHHPLVEQEPEAAMDGDEDRRVRRRVQRREEIDLVALVRTISKLQPRSGQRTAALAEKRLPMGNDGGVDIVGVAGIEVGRGLVALISQHF
jgi:hypothetical protein